MLQIIMAFGILRVHGNTIIYSLKDIKTFYGSTLTPPGLAKLSYLGNGKIKIVLTLKGQNTMRKQGDSLPTLVFRINYLDNNNNFGYGNLIINWE